MSRLCVSALLVGGSLYAQPAARRPEFEVASVKPAALQAQNTAAAGIRIDGAQVRVSSFPLKEFLSIAYRLRANQIVGPEWMGSEKFDIAAKLPEGSSRDQIPEMLQVLLEDRFQLKTRRDKKEFAVYGLVAARGGLKVQPLPPDPNDGAVNAFEVTASGGPAGVTVNFGKGSSFGLGNNRFEVKNLSMTEFADALTRFVDRTVVDMTGASGKYSFSIEMTPEDYRSVLIRAAVNNGVTLPPQALQLLEGFSAESALLALQTIGLKIESRKTPLDVLVVESVSKTPTAN